MQKLQIENRMMSLTRKFVFDSAHKLSNYKGKCKHLHGHTYLLKVTIRGTINEKTGIIMDFGDIEKIVNELVIKRLDHHYINDVIKIPTAENIVRWIWKVLSPEFKRYKIGLYKLELQETPSSSVSYEI
jgi:6-pyruvoyltetrahydropterin/6-carboxytetrahydropterin synthase